MSDCETYEMSISALADGELPAEDLLPTLDHLADCASCRAFYRDVRALAAALPAEAASSPSDEAPEEIWHRIEAATVPALSHPGPAPSWRLRLAAAILLVAGLWGALATVSAFRPADQPIEVTLGGDGGRMTEQRFVDLTVELLRADSRYRQEMLQVLTAVGERGSGQEAPVDHDVPLPEGDDGASGDWQAGRRLS